jgi:hypothetical protein
MNAPIGLLGVLAVAVGLVSAPFHRRQVELAQGATITPCAADSGYQRLAFWVGDWDVFDSTGAPYATQRVSAEIDQCAITAEWASSGGNKGMGLSAFDMKTHEWKQVYVSNQVPFRSGVSLRTSDPLHGARHPFHFAPPPNGSRSCAVSRDDHAVERPPRIAGVRGFAGRRKHVACSLQGRTPLESDSDDVRARIESLQCGPRQLWGAYAQPHRAVDLNGPVGFGAPISSRKALLTL